MAYRGDRTALSVARHRKRTQPAARHERHSRLMCRAASASAPAAQPAPASHTPTTRPHHQASNAADPASRRPTPGPTQPHAATGASTSNCAPSCSMRSCQASHAGGAAGRSPARLTPSSATTTTTAPDTAASNTPSATKAHPTSVANKAPHNQARPHSQPCTSHTPGRPNPGQGPAVTDSSGRRGMMMVCMCYTPFFHRGERA